jgi:hypothetical protein
MVGIDNHPADPGRTPVNTDVRTEVSRRLTAEYGDRFSAAQTQQVVDRCWEDLAEGGGNPTFGMLGRISRRRLEDLALHARVGRAESGITARRGRTVLL